jgi:hypothetical protein
MILEMNGQLINAFIEPQFSEVSSGHLVTVQFSDLDGLGKFKHHLQGDIRVDLTDKFFHFTGYTQFLDVNCLASGKSLTIADLVVSKDISPAPAAYGWLGWEEHTEDEDGNLIQGEDWQGYSLPEEIHDLRWSLPTSLEEFYVFPLFSLQLTALVS